MVTRPLLPRGNAQRAFAPDRQFFLVARKKTQAFS
jgi:hypothetical protein